jgi:hypothetical protein
MARPILDPATAARIRADLKHAQTMSQNTIGDRVLAIERAVETLLCAIEAAK